MTYKSTIRLILVIVTITGMVSPGNALAEEIIFQATIFPLQGKPIFVEDFSLNGEHFYDAVQKGKRSKLPFKDIKTIRFINPGKSYRVEVIFSDGRKGTYVLQPSENIVIRSQATVVSLSHSKVAKIEFGPSARQAETENATSDIILLRSLHNIHGYVQTKVFKVRTPYGNLNFESSQISYISFDGKGKNIDFIVLKNGDTLRGAVETESVKFLTNSGTEMNLDRKKIKRISFKGSDLVVDTAIKKQ